MNDVIMGDCWGQNTDYESLNQPHSSEQVGDGDCIPRAEKQTWREGEKEGGRHDGNHRAHLSPQGPYLGHLQQEGLYHVPGGPRGIGVLLVLLYFLDGKTCQSAHVAEQLRQTARKPVEEAGEHLIGLRGEGVAIREGLAGQWKTMG